MAELSTAEKMKLSRLEFEHKQDLLEAQSLTDEIKALKDIQQEKKSKKEKSKGEIFSNEVESHVDTDAYLANLYGTAQTTPKPAETERVVNFADM